MKPILLDIPEQFETERLVISNYENDDGEEFFRLLQANYAHLQEEVSDVHNLKTIEDAEEYIRGKKLPGYPANGWCPKSWKNPPAR